MRGHYLGLWSLAQLVWQHLQRIAGKPKILLCHQLANFNNLKQSGTFLFCLSSWHVDLKKCHDDFIYLWSECMKYHTFKLRVKDLQDLHERPSQLCTHFKQLWKESQKKIQACRTGFEPMTSAIPVQCSTNWAIIIIKPTGSWSLCEFVIYP